MHKSRLAGFIIDCETDDLDAAAGFWSAALGLERKPFDDPEEAAAYIGLRTDADDLHIEVQKVAHTSRVHLDIEADDLEAEARRLEALGARRIGMVKRWIVMEAPTGQRFCIVQPQRRDFDDRANTWD
ncbi:VOC family protein [Elongatibacter sediminis]|uniref:VOC family protein n=1 Tax=Elongatibacter sediminis TaxID=3119006 RepID=A0AAW9RF37_9GAMM